ncbi:MAG: response regulator transcription factor, partial [Actinomycetota bacterium]
MSGPLRVLVVDDQALIRAGFSMILDSEPDIDVVGQASNGAEAIGLVRELGPDVVIMDVRMPVMDGIAATAEICSRSEAPWVLMLTTFDADDYVYDALKAGASGFLLKDTRPDDLAAAVRIVAAGEAVLAPSVTRRLVDEVGRTTVKTRELPGVADLTERESEVLVSLARGLSNAEMAEALFVSEATVKTHISHILTKLELRDRVQAVVAAYESGLVTP